MIIDRCTQHNPDNRFQHVSDLRTVWQSLHDETSLKSELEEFLQLRTRLATESRISKKDANRFCDLMIKHLGEHDLVHDTVMQISPQAAEAIYIANADLVRRLIAEFVEFVCSQGWPFGYTDKLGRKCKNLYHAIQDSKIRADLIYCVAEVGISHNRFYIMNLMEGLFALDRDTAESMAIERRFLAGNDSLRRKVGENINLTRLPASLRAIFAFDN
jgi:hypothetical protein